MSWRARRLLMVVVSVTLAAAVSVIGGDPPIGVDALTSRTGETVRVTRQAVRVDAPERHLTLAATGDILPHSPLWARAAQNAGGSGYDFAPMFADIAPIIRPAAVAICHLETPIAPAGEALTTSPVYGVPVQIAAAISAAGYDRCSTASNHTFDRGVAGIDRTVSALTAAGVQQSGMARFPAEATPAVLPVNGIAVAHLSYTYGFNGAAVPAGEPWRSNLIDVPDIVAAGRAARARGAELVVLSLHWGVEYQQRPSSDQRRIAEAVTASGAVDLIIGHHAHVVQPIEQINGVWVAFGLGNSLSNMRDSQWFPAASQDGVIAVFPVNAPPGGGRAVVGRPHVVPTWVDRDNGWVIRDVVSHLADPSIPASRQRALLQSLSRTRSVVGEFVPVRAPTATNRR